MKIVELLVEGYGEQLVSDLTDYLTVVKSRGMDKIETDVLVKALNKAGHNVNGNSIMTVLKDNPMVQTATPAEVHIAPDEDEVGGAISGGDDAEDENQERVTQMAQQAVDIE